MNPNVAVKRVVKRAMVAAWSWMPKLDRGPRRVVLCYHSVHPDPFFLSTSPALFEEHLQWLVEHCHITSFADLVTNPPMMDDGRPLVAITFDDGYADNHVHALPILTRWRVSATFFLTAGFLERDPGVLHRFQHLLKSAPEHLTPLDWSQVRDLHASGMDIGSHSYGHPNLARLTASETDVELRRSKDLISARLGTEVNLLSYPFGKPKVHFTDLTVSVARVAGYRLAASVVSRGVRSSDSLLAVPRFFADGDNLDKLEARICGAYELIGWWQEHAPVPIMRMVSPQDFEP